MNEPLDLSRLKPGDRITIDVVVYKVDSRRIEVETPNACDSAVFEVCNFGSCNPRLTDQSPDTGKTIDHISDPQEKVNTLEIEGVRIAREKRAEDRFVVETWQMWFANTLTADSSHEALCVIEGLPKFLKENGLDIGKLFAEVD